MARNLLKVALPAVAVSAVLVLGAWMLFANTAPESVPTTRAAGADPRSSAQPAEIAQAEDLMLAARSALNEQRVLAPPGNNAVEYYLQAMDEDSSNVAARQALLELIPPAVDSVQRSITAGDLDEAERRLALLKRTGISELRLNLVRTELISARTKREQEAARAREAATVAAQMPVMTTPPVPSPTQNLPDASQSPIRSDSSPAATRQSTPPVASIPAPAAAEPEPPAPTPAAPVLRVEEPRQIVDAAPAYPSQALQRRIEGVVELEFSVERDGSVSGIEVIASDPARIFDREAVRAAQRWRFEPRRENGVAVESRVRKTLQFRLKSSRAG
ncbi:MAG: energy transducer TonB [Lysobacterales bacterium]